MTTEKIVVTLTIAEADAIYFAAQNALRKGAPLHHGKTVMQNAILALQYATMDMADITEGASR